jgi:syntaxin-binding protein 1
MLNLLVNFQEHVAGKLDLSLFPYVKDPPAPVPVAPSMRTTPSQTTSLRSAKPNWHKAAKPGAVTETRQRVLVFVAGGVTFSEVREAYQLSNTLGKDIYIGMVQCPFWLLSV